MLLIKLLFEFWQMVTSKVPREISRYPYAKIFTAQFFLKSHVWFIGVFPFQRNTLR